MDMLLLVKNRSREFFWNNFLTDDASCVHNLTPNERLNIFAETQQFWNQPPDRKICTQFLKIQMQWFWRSKCLMWLLLVVLYFQNSWKTISVKTKIRESLSNGILMQHKNRLIHIFMSLSGLSLTRKQFQMSLEWQAWISKLYRDSWTNINGFHYFIV